MSMLSESTVEDRKSPGSEPLFHIFVLCLKGFLVLAWNNTL